MLVSNVGEKANEINLPRAMEDSPSVKTFKSRRFPKECPRLAALPWVIHETDLVWLRSLCYRGAQEKVHNAMPLSQHLVSLTSFISGSNG